MSVLIAGACIEPDDPQAIDAGAVKDSGADASNAPDAGDAGGSEFSYANCSESEFPSDLGTLIENKLAEYPAIPGAVVAIYHPSQGYIVASYGLQHVANKTPMSVDGIFDIGSVHKLFKWIVMEKLFEEEAFSYSDLISTHLSSPTLAGTTIYDLTDHATGMVDIGSNFIDDILAKNSAGDLPHNYSYEEMMGFLVSDTSAGTTNGILDDFAVGNGYKYSSYGPVIAGEIAELLSGKNSNELVRELIINPLGLGKTSIIGYDLFPERVQGYGGKSASDAYGPLPDSIMSSVSAGNEGAIFSTACDLLNFSRAISDSDIEYLASTTIESRTQSAYDIPTYLKIGRGMMNYYGWGTGDFWAHAGDGMSSHSSMMGYNPSNGVRAVILTNLSPKFIDQEHGIHHDIIAIANAYYE